MEITSGNFLPVKFPFMPKNILVASKIDKKINNISSGHKFLAG
jgi:hypothetical protein